MSTVDWPTKQARDGRVEIDASRLKDVILKVAFNGAPHEIHLNPTWADLDGQPVYSMEDYARQMAVEMLGRAELVPVLFDEP